MMETTLEEIDNLVNVLAKLQPMKPGDQERLHKKIRLEFNYNSNHIEGNTLTYGETQLLLFFDKTTGNHELREYEEMKAHDAAYKIIQEWANDTERPFTETDLKNLHEILLVRPFWKDAQTADGSQTKRLIEVGNYKTQPNSVRLPNGEMFHYTSPQETPIQMGELIQWYRDETEKKELHPVALAGLLHYKFVRIHPFDDGNGRMSRLLMNYVLLKHGLPPVIIKASAKKEYLFALNQADAGDLNAFVFYIADQLLWSLNLFIDAAKGKNLDEPQDLDKKLFLLKKELGQATDSQIKKLSSVVIEEILVASIFPLMEAWEKQCESFDSLFLNRVMSLNMADATYEGQSFDESIFQKIFNWANYLFQQEPINQKFSINCVFEGLSNYDNLINFNGGQVDIIFHNNAYEIKWLPVNKGITKSYNVALDETEIDTIVSDMGNWVFKSIEEFLEQKKTENT